MSETDAAIEHYHSLGPTQFSELVRFELKLYFEPEWEEWGPGYHLTIGLRSGQSTDRSLLLLTFSGVRQLQFVPAELSIIPVYLNVVCIRERQWEGTNY